MLQFLVLLLWPGKNYQNSTLKYFYRILFFIWFYKFRSKRDCMKILEVKKEIFDTPYPDLEEVSSRLDNIGPGVPVETLNWESYRYKPEVSFNIAYSDKEILLKYYVKEGYVKAEKTKSNQMVCEDSCVEFFVSPADDGIYYNFEFNPIGTCLLGTGTCRADSSPAPVIAIEGIRRKGSLGNSPFPERIGEYSWNITIAISTEVFFRHRVGELKGKTFRANFYKCGDKLTHAHYLTWNPVETGNPDYHRPEYFGMLRFV